jgi:predicted dehydrogenase
MRFLIAGLGSVGRRHLRNLLSLGERDIILFRTGKSTLPEDELQGLPVEHDLDVALGRRPDAVIVANPTALHLDVAIPAAEAGCDLLIEKPVSHSMERVADLQRAVERGGGRVLIGYQYRFHPGLRQLKAWVDSAAIGSVVSATAEYGDFLPAWHPWEDHRLSYSARAELGGGAILTLSHTVDLLLWMFGKAHLVASSSRVVPEVAADTESAATLMLEFDRGPSAIARMDYLRNPKVHRVEVVGTLGSAGWDEETGNALMRRSNPAGVTRVDPPPGFDRNDMFVAELAHFIRLMKGEDESVTSLHDGIRTLQILDLAKQRDVPSLRTAEESS